MASNQPEDYYEESGTHSGSGGSSPATYSTSSPSPDAHGSLGANGLTSSDMDLKGMGEGIGDASMQSSPYQGIEAPRPSPAQEAARAAQKTATKSKSPTRGDSPSPTSMAKKRSNQPK